MNGDTIFYYYYFFWAFVSFCVMLLSTCLHKTDLDHCGLSESEVVVQMRVINTLL